MVNLVESASRAGEQDNPRLVLEDLAQPPARVRVRHVPEHHVQILDHQYEPLTLSIREVEQSAKAAFSKSLVVLNGT